MATDAAIKREHVYLAEAHLLSGNLELPLEQLIETQAFAKLPDHGGYLSQQAREYRLEGAISYRSGYTQVAGNRETKIGHGWSTLATAVVEDLNVLDVVTADRVVAQVTTEHPLEGYVPHITFLGTRFENLRIGGHKVELDLDLEICGKKPDDDQPYTRSTEFVDKVTRQHARIHDLSKPHLSALGDLFKQYNRTPESFTSADGREENVGCSLVNQASGSYPGHSFGHVIVVPNFGTIHLAELHIRHSEYHPEKKRPTKTHVDLKMLHIKMGCLATGKVGIATTKTNGHSKP